MSGTYDDKNLESGAARPEAAADGRSGPSAPVSPGAAAGASTGLDPSRVRLKVRADLRAALHHSSGGAYYVVEDPASARFYRIGVREWAFVTLLDGRKTLAEALRDANGQSDTEGLSAADAAQLCRWLLQGQLAVPLAVGSGSPLPLSRAAGCRSHTMINPFFSQFPLGNPDRLLAAAVPWCRPLFSLPCLGLWLVLLATGLHALAAGWGQFTADTAHLLSPVHWPILLVEWLLLKLLHETAHAIACKHYGGEVSRAGLAFRLFSPLPYVDVTSCWRMRSKWQRIVISAAGMYAELAVAALAALVWSATRPGAVHVLAHNVVLAAGLTTLLFNLNPLMRFDGYYMLCDGLGITNLYARGQAYVHYLGRRYLLGMKAELPRHTGVFVKVYGVLALVWRVSVLTTLAMLAAVMFHGLGVILSAAGILLWLGPPFRRLAMLVWKGDRGQRPHWRSVGVRMAVLGTAAAALAAMPWPGAISAPAIVEYAPLTVVRVDSPGFLQELRVKAGDEVRAGQILAVLDNDDSQATLEDLKLQIEESLIRCRVYYKDKELAKYQAEQKKLESLRDKHQQIQQCVDSLVVRAPRPGRVIGRNLDTLLGQYLAAGAQLMAIGAEDRKELVALVAQEDVDVLQIDALQPVTARVHGRWQLLRGVRIEALVPRASVDLAYPALGAQHGGPLDVRPELRSADAPSPGPAGQYELLAPRFTVRLAIPAAAAAGLRAGELATAWLTGPYESAGSHLVRWAGGWLRQTLSGCGGNA